METIITKDSLKDMLEGADFTRLQHIVGHALVVLFKRQTAAEQNANKTDVDNGIGFAGADAYGGCMTAKYYIKHHALEQWQIDKWMKLTKTGYPRLCKYHKQLNEAAVEKLSRKAKQA